MVLDSPERRRKVIEMLWDLAYRRIEGPDNRGESVDANEVWSLFNSMLDELGLEVSAIAKDGSDVILPNDLAAHMEVVR